MNSLSPKTLRSIGFLCLVFVLSYFFSKGIVENNIRIIFVIGLLLVLGTLCLNITTGVISLLVFLPFMAFLRRCVYASNPYVKLDPILIVADALTIFMFSYIFLFEGKQLRKWFKENRVVRYITFLLLICVLQIFNPLQGGILVGLAGAKFWIVPMLWFYLGLYITERKMEFIFYLIIAIGVITAIYGLYQVFYGFTDFEKYWVNYGGYTALKVGKYIRPFSTFASAQEYTTFLMISGIITVAYIVRRQRNLYLLLALGIIFYGLIMASARGAILGFLIGSGLFLILGLRNFKKIVLASIAIIFISSILISQVSLPESPIETEHSIKRTLIEHTASGITDPFAKSSTLWYRFQGASSAFFRVIRNPLGLGLGVGNLAAFKFGSSGDATVPETFFLIGSMMKIGILGGILLILIFYHFIKWNFVSYVEKNDFFCRLEVVIFFVILICGGLALYSTGPISWLLLGWGTKRLTDEQKD